MKICYILLCVLFTTLIVQSNWPVYQHDSAHSGFSLSHILYPLKEKWSYKGDSGPYFVVSGKRVYAREQSRVFCLENGSVLWAQVGFLHIPTKVT